MTSLYFSNLVFPQHIFSAAITFHPVHWHLLTGVLKYCSSTDDLKQFWFICYKEVLSRSVVCSVHT